MTDERTQPCPSCGAAVPWFMEGDEHCDECWRSGRNLNWVALAGAAAISIGMWAVLIFVLVSLH